MAFASDLTETALQIAAMRFSFGINIICIFFRGMVAGRFRLAGYEVMDENYDFPLIPPYPFYYSLFVAVYFLPGSIG